MTLNREDRGIMGRICIFLSCVFLLATANAETRQCFDLFRAAPKPFQKARSAFAPEDLRSTGLFLKVNDAFFNNAIATLMRHRDGTYALLIDTSGSVILSHRLPRVNPEPGAPYLATHRGLYEKLGQDLGHTPQVVFAGEILVVGGKAMRLIDQASTFHDVATEETFSVYGDQAQARLIASNQLRLDFAAKILKDRQIIDAQTQVVNFVKWAGQTPDRYMGHTTAKKAAEFEIHCRTSPSCWGQVLRLEEYLKTVMNLGGSQYLMQNMTKWTRTQPDVIYDFLSVLELFISDGVFETLSGQGRMDPQSESGRPIAKFYELMDSPLGISVITP